MHSASERYSTHVFRFSEEDISFKHGEYTFHHTLAFTRTIKITESYHDIERHCAGYLFNALVAPVLIMHIERKVGIQSNNDFLNPQFLKPHNNQGSQKVPSGHPGQDDFSEQQVTIHSHLPEWQGPHQVICCCKSKYSGMPIF